MNLNLMMNKPTYFDNDYTMSEKFNGDSRLVLGTAGIGGLWGDVRENESIDALLYALDNGVEVLDTSPSYRDAQEFVGKALARWTGPKPFISTKVGRLKADEPDEVYLDYSRDGMRKSVHKSLDLIGVDKIDLLFLHEPQLVPIDRIDEILETLGSFKDEGLVDRLGVGGNPVDEFYDYIDGDLFDAVSGFLKLDACSLDALDKDIPLFHKQDIAYYAASSLHMGLLGDRYQELTEERPGTQWVTDQQVDNAIKVHELAQQNDMSLSELSLRYLISIKEADRVVLGARNKQQVKGSLSFWEDGLLPRELFDEVTEIIIESEINATDNIK